MNCPRCYATILGTPACPGCGLAVPTQPPPVDPTAGAEARDMALGNVYQNADSDWIDAALRIADALAHTRAEFTTDAVWEALARTNLTTPEPRAMGAIMRKLVAKKLIRNSRRTQQSTRPECHCRPVTVWESLVYGR